MPMMMSSPERTVVEIRTSSAKDPDGRHFRELLQAIDRVNRLGQIRSLAVHALAVLGVVPWMSVALPAVVPELLRDLGILAFAGTALAAMLAIALESRWHRIQRLRMEQTDARVLGDGPAACHRQ